MRADQNSCLGCTACYSTCPVSAIQMHFNKDGFLTAKKDSNKCIKCGKCDEVCKRLDFSSNNLRIPIVYAGWAKDEKIHRESNSGGLFYVFGKYVIEHGGVVVAPVVEEGLKVEHICAETQADLKRQCWSKFTQSDLRVSYSNILNYLNNNRQVLFVGSPCQVKGLYAFLGREFENLITVQFPCIGLPAQKYFREYWECFSGKTADEILNVYGEVISKLGDKHRSMISVLKTGEKKVCSAVNDAFVSFWNRGYLINDQCFECRLNIPPVQADFTWGNFWQIGLLTPFKANEKRKKQGISMLLINSEKGRNFFEKVKNNLEYYQRNWVEAASGHFMFQTNWNNHILMRKYAKSEIRKEFKEQSISKNFSALQSEFHRPKERNIFNLAKIITPRIKAIIWRILYYYHVLTVKESKDEE